MSEVRLGEPPTPGRFQVPQAGPMQQGPARASADAFDLD